MGLDVAARLIEVIADQPPGAFLAERIFASLGMSDTAFGVPDGKLGRLAAVYGLPDVFAKGLSLADVAQAAAAGMNDRVDVSDTYPTDRPEVFARGGFGLFSTAGPRHGGDDVPKPPPARVVHVRAVRATYPGQCFGLGSSVVLDVAETGSCGSVGEHGWSGAAKTTFWVHPTQDITWCSWPSTCSAPQHPSKIVRQLVYQALLT